MYSPKDDDCHAFVPFCCQQQLKGGVARIGIVFICEVENREPTAELREVKDIRWIKKASLEELFRSHPERFFTLQLGVLELYFDSSRAGEKDSATGRPASPG